MKIKNLKENCLSEKENDVTKQRYRKYNKNIKGKKTNHRNKHTDRQTKERVENSDKKAWFWFHQAF